MRANSSKRKSDDQPDTSKNTQTRWDAAHNSVTYGPDKPPTRTNSSRERVSYFWPDISKQLEKFTFFWRADSPFSQHHPAKFFLDGSMFNCSEQYYMYRKAVTFHDDLCARKIMGTSDPAKQKSLAKGIQYFDQKIWDNISYDVVKRANIAKFGANERLLNLLVATRGTELVEASPKDHKWGIGLEADRSDALRRITWRGENKLGKILTEIRDTEFKGVEYKPEKLLHDKLYGYLYFWRSSSPFSPKHLAPFEVGDLSFVSLFHFLMFKSAELSGNKRTVDQITREMKQNIIEKVAYKNEINEHAWKLSMTGNLIEGNFYKFGDNPNLKALLLATNGKMLVFQSRFEGIGNGLEEEDSYDLVTSGDWRVTTNLLGSILTFMRDEWIKKPNITLDEFKSKKLPSYNLDAIDMMHMRCVEPPLLKECIDQPQPSNAKPEDTKKEEAQKMEDSIWNHDSNKTAATKTDGDANDSKKEKDNKKAVKKLEHKSEEASCNKSETFKKSEADDKFKKLLQSSSKDKKMQESQDMEIDLSDDDKTEKPNEKSKKTKSQEKRKDKKNEENQKMEDSMRVYDSNKTATTKIVADANDSKKKKMEDNKRAAKELEPKSEEASCNKSETCKKSEADDKFKKLLPGSSKDKKMQESQDMEIDLSGDDDDDEKTGEPEEKSKKSKSQKKREKKRRQKERRK